jgi:hypothetical protein
MPGEERICRVGCGGEAETSFAGGNAMKSFEYLFQYLDHVKFVLYVQYSTYFLYICTGHILADLLRL